GPAVALGGVTSLRVDLVQDAFDSIAALDRLVEEEFEDWDPLQSQPAAELPAEERGGTAQCPGGVAPGLLVAERGVVDAGHLQVRRHGDLRDGQKADAGVVYLAREEIGDLRAQLIANT